MLRPGEYGADPYAPPPAGYAGPGAAYPVGGGPSYGAWRGWGGGPRGPAGPTRPTGGGGAGAGAVDHSRYIHMLERELDEARVALQQMQARSSDTVMQARMAAQEEGRLGKEQMIKMETDMRRQGLRMREVEQDNLHLKSNLEQAQREAKRLVTVEEDRQRMQLRVTELEQKADSERQHLRREYDLKIKTLEAEIGMLKQGSKTQEHTIVSMRQQHEDAVAASRDSSDKQQKHVETLRKQRDEADAKRKELQVTVDSFKQQLQRKQELVDLLEQESAHKQERIDQAGKAHSDVTGELAEKAEEAARLQVRANPPARMRSIARALSSPFRP